MSAISKARAKSKQRGITLIELLVVLTILGLISALVVINVLPAQDQAKVKKARIDVDTIETALEQYRLDVGNYPTTEQGLEALVEAPTNIARPEDYRPGGYLRCGVPLDPWNKEYQYRFPGDRGVIDIWSYGADGEEGGEDFAADIGNWPTERR